MAIDTIKITSHPWELCICCGVRAFVRDGAVFPENGWSKVKSPPGEIELWLCPDCLSREVSLETAVQELERQDPERPLEALAAEMGWGQTEAATERLVQKLDRLMERQESIIAQMEALEIEEPSPSEEELLIYYGELEVRETSKLEQVTELNDQLVTLLEALTPEDMSEPGLKMYRKAGRERALRYLAKTMGD